MDSMDSAALLEGRSRETEIRRDAAGRWWNGPDPVGHAGVERSFDGWLDRGEDGRFFLKNDINWAYVEIEGPAYFVRATSLDAEGVTLSLSGGREERLDPATLRQDEEGALYCDVREGRCPARFENHASAGLAERIAEDETGVYLALGGARVRPPIVSEPLNAGAAR